MASISRIETAAEPERLTAAGVSDFEAKLLGSARADVMPFGSRRRVMAQLGVGGVLSTSAMASAVKAAGLKAGLSLAAAGTTVAGAVALLLSQGTAEPPAPVTAPPATVVQVAPVAPAPVATQAAPAPAVEEEEPVQKAPASRPQPRASDALAAELRALEEARGAFVGGDYARALRLLDAYNARFPRRSLGTEATVLRIETLVKRGDRAQATRLGKEFLARHAGGPYARRVRSLIGEPTQP